MAITNPTIQQLMESAIAKQATAKVDIVKTAEASQVEPGLYNDAIAVAEEMEKVAAAIAPEQAAELQAVLGKIFGPERSQVLFQRLDEIKMRQDQMAQPAQPPMAQPAAAPPPAAPPMAGVTPEAAPAMPATQPEKTAAIQRLTAMFSDNGDNGDYDQLKTLIADFAAE
jgi:hypothetical protein